MRFLPHARGLRFATLALAIVSLVLLVAGLAFLAWKPSNQELAQRVAAHAEARLGVPVAVESLSWHLLPAPHVELRGIETRQDRAVRLERVVVWPSVRDALRLRWTVDRLHLDGGRVHQLAVREWTRREPRMPDRAQRPVAHLTFERITLVTRTGRALAFDGDVVFDGGWLPRTGTLRRSDAAVPVALQVDREAAADGAPDRWRLQADAGGGRSEGSVTLEPAADGRVRLAGSLQSRGIDLTALLAAFGRNAVVQGTLAGETTLSAEGASFGELARHLRTRSEFRVAPAAVVRFDLGRAVRTVGRETAGTTPLDSLTGRLDTRNTAEGIVLRYSRVKATSGALTATGEATLFKRQVQGSVTVDLVDGVVGVPLQIGGTLDDLTFSVSKSAAAGAAVGTVLLPGIGTALGLRLGEAIGKLFD